MFLWGLPPPPPEVREFNPRGDAWWRQYRSALRLSSAALRELAKTSRDIVALLPEPSRWDDRPSPFKGLVVGAVQSGKTQSMMGVAAVALDQGFRIIIVLAGLKDDLRQQTARRFNTQLLRQSDLIPGGKGATTLGRPAGKGLLGGFAPPYSLDTHQFTRLQLKAEDALGDDEPCVIVVKKNVVSLADLRNTLMYVYRTYGVENLPTLVIDDESDDASVGGEPDEELPIPRSIANLWRREGEAPRVAYVGYTATAAANVLQSADNELYPSHFVYLLRYPGETESPLEFAESDADGWYTGSDCFYGAFGDESGEASNFLISTEIEAEHLDRPVSENPSFREALRAFFVGGAFRIAIEPERSFGDGVCLPLPHSMLVQTSTSVGEHIRWAKGLGEMCGGRELPDKSIVFDVDVLDKMASEEEEAWREWYQRFDAARERVYRQRPHAKSQRPVTWQQVRSKLRTVFENTHLRIVNSDENIGSALDYGPRLGASGEALPPQDIYVIVIGGAKLSRGITIEGLCVSYFARWNPNPREDTIQQMSRWFGYRGQHLEFCRVFTSEAVYEHLKDIHENDMDLRHQLAELMAGQTPLSDASLVIRANPRGLPSGKIGDAAVVDLSYSPYANVLPYVECGTLSERNEITAKELVGRVRGRKSEAVLTLGGTTRGLLSKGWSAMEVADLLDSLEYSGHNPDRATNLMREFYREPDAGRPVATVMPVRDDPYQIAAYLRWWTAQGGVPTFNVGFVLADMEEDCGPFDFGLINRQINHLGRLVGGWTGRSDSWRGDAYFDDPPLGLRAPGSQRRLAGSDGLVLLYVVHREATGRAGKGMRRQRHTPALGVSIPAGGPAFRRLVPGAAR